MKKIIALVLALVLTVAASVAGTVAYLQSEDSDVNVMTLGNVEIEQIEQEYDADGKLVDFTQAKPLYPYVGELGWKNISTGGGAYRQFTMENVVDKYVSVKNTGKSDAYVRTLIALEMGDYTYDNFDMVGISINSVDGAEFDFPGTWAYDSTKDFVAEIDGQKYYVMEFVHQTAVAPRETTIPSLLQVYLSKDATNETVEKLDGNDNGTYEILALSQAVQTKGFNDAETALNAAFGAITATNHPWVKSVVLVDEPYFQNYDAPAGDPIDGQGQTVVGVATSIDAFQWEGGTIPAMSPIFSSSDGSQVTVSDITFTGTMSAVMAGHYVNSSSNWFKTEFNNVNIIDAEVVSFSAGISPALVVYGTLTMNSCEVTGTTLSELDTDPMWPVYDVAVVNNAKLIANNSTFGSIMGGEAGTGHYWSKSYIELNNSTADVIYACGRTTGNGTFINNGSKVDKVIASNSKGVVIKVAEGAVVDTLDLSAIDSSATSTIEINGTVKHIVANNVEYATIEAWKTAHP